MSETGASAGTTPDPSPSIPGQGPPPGPGGQELLVDFILSLDGCAAAEGWPGWWGLQSPEYLDWLGQEPERIQLMGATTYRMMSEMAQQAESLDVSAEEKASFAHMAEVEKIVFSSTLDSPLTWPNSRLISTDAAEAVRELKRTASRPLTTVGSIRLSHSLLRAGLVDRFRIILFPVITGRTGLERIWERFEDFTLELIGTRTFEGGLQLLEYVPTPLDAPPGTAWQRP